MNKLIILVLISFVCSCSQPETASIDRATDTLSADYNVLPSSLFTEEDIAKFAISTIINQLPAIMQAETKENINISYTRKGDNKKFEYKIKFEGNNIFWGNSNGRWRNVESDEKLSYETVGDKVNIHQYYSDGSFSKTTFAKKDL